MDFKFSKESSDSQQHEAPGEKKNQSALLVLLLILVGGFTYIYFLTALIKPLETEKSVEAPAPAPQVVKIPLPPRDGESAKPETKVATKAEPPKTATTAPVAAAAEDAAGVNYDGVGTVVSDELSAEDAVVAVEVHAPEAGLL